MKRLILILFIIPLFSFSQNIWFNSYPQIGGSLPTVVLNSITNTGGGWCSYLWSGNATSDGGSTITKKGFVWNTSGNPTLNDTEWILSSSGTGSYSYSIPSFSGSTTYYGRAYATNSYGTAYSNEISFTTSSSATAYFSYSQVCNSSVDVTANISSNGNTITTRELFYGINNYNEHYNNAGSGNSSYTWNLTGLTSNTTYNYLMNITTNNCTVLSQQGTFVTPNFTTPTVTTDQYANVTNTSAGLYGTINSNGGQTPIQNGFVYSTNSNPTLSDNVIYSTTHSGSFNETISGLSAGTTYHFRTFATNCIATGYGSDMSFTTTGSCSQLIAMGISYMNYPNNPREFKTSITDVNNCGYSITNRYIYFNTSGIETDESGGVYTQSLDYGDITTFISKPSGWYYYGVYVSFSNGYSQRLIIPTAAYLP